MMVCAGFAEPWVGGTLPSAMYKLADGETAAVGVDRAVPLSRGHSCASDEVPGDRQLLLDRLVVRAQARGS
jgi:hypothetical protein